MKDSFVIQHIHTSGSSPSKIEGVRLQAIELPKKLPKDREKWILENISSSADAIVLTEGILKLWPSFPTLLKDLENTEYRFIPVFLICDQLHDEVRSWEVDDVITPAQLDEIQARVSIRKRTARLYRELFEQNISRINKQAERETAIKQREEFLSICAHDLRSPLGLIMSSLSMVLASDDKKGLSRLSEELLVRAKRQSDHAINLVNDLLDVMSYEQGLKPDYELFDLDNFLSEFHQDYKLQAEQKKINFEFKNEVPGWRVLADKDRVRQLLQNLFANAVKFTESGKAIHLEARPFIGRRKSDPKHPMVIISVRDEGRGIPEDEVKKIFDKFSQLKDYSRAEGRGLGLTVAKQISQHHGGNVWVESKEGQGSTFHVLLPDVLSQPKPKKAGDKKSLLVVVPSESHRNELFTGISSWGYELHFSHDGVSALTTAFYHQPDIIILTPGITKIRENQVANILKGDALTRNIPLILGVDRRSEDVKRQDESILVDAVAAVPFHSEQGLVDVLKEIENKKKAA